MSPRTEEELLDATIDLATRCRWRVFHPRPARRGDGQWRTATQGHNGWPDLALARRGLLLLRELKGYDARGRLGKLSDDQIDWGKELDPSWHRLMSGERTPWPPTIETSVGPVGIPLFAVWTPPDWDAVIVPTLTAKIGANT